MQRAMLRSDMAENAIVEKLRAKLAGAINTEAEVVYFLCEIRKLLDYRDPSHSPSPLRMFCHWALHVDLERRGTTKPFVQQVDEVVSNLIGGISNHDTFVAEHALITEFASFTTFRIELRKFLDSHRLPVDLCDDDERWFGFLEAYAGVIQDGSLFCQLTTIERVTFTKTRSTLQGNKMSFAAKWVLSLRNPYKGFNKIEIDAEKSDGMLASSFHLR